MGGGGRETQTQQNEKKHRKSGAKKKRTNRERESAQQYARKEAYEESVEEMSETKRHGGSDGAAQVLYCNLVSLSAAPVSPPTAPQQKSSADWQPANEGGILSPSSPPRRADRARDLRCSALSQHTAVRAGRTRKYVHVHHPTTGGATSSASSRSQKCHPQLSNPNAPQGTD